MRRRIFKNILVLGLKAANCNKENFSSNKPNDMQ